MNTDKRPVRPGQRLPRVVRYVLQNAAIGALLGIVIAGLLIATNVGGLRWLIQEQADPVTPVVLVVVGFATLMGGVCAAAAIMWMPDED